MEDFEIRVEGAPVVFSTSPPKPHNPLNRPEIHYKKPIIAAIIWLVITGTLLGCGLVWFPGYTVWAILGWSVLYFAVIGKRAVIWLVHLYQNKASDATRLKCLFEPSCSEYMILALKKYGLVRGLFKGIRRLFRCHLPNGGIDYP